MRHFIFLLFLTVAAVSCEKLGPEIQCGGINYLVGEVGGRYFKANIQYSYNDTLVSGINGANLFYDAENRLTEVTGGIRFFYNDQGLPEYAWKETYPDNDSISFEYNAQNQLVKATFYTIETDIFTLHDTLLLSDYMVFEYTGNNVTTLKWYYRSLEIGRPLELNHITELTYDTNPKPHPKHLDLYLLCKERKLISENNIVSEIHTNVKTGERFTQKYTYAYNADGYPVQKYFDRKLVREYKYSCGLAMN